MAACREQEAAQQPPLWQASRLQPLLQPCFSRSIERRPSAEQLQQRTSQLGQHM